LVVSRWIVLGAFNYGIASDGWGQILLSGFTYRQRKKPEARFPEPPPKKRIPS
jgi:hypothetical protein